MATLPETKAPTSSPWLARILAAALAAGAGLVRLVPHAWNFTPVGAIGLFAGGRLGKWGAFTLPLGVMALTDMLLWMLRGPDYSPLHVTRLFVYPSILLYAVIGRLLAASESPWRIGCASLLGSLQFFLLTNFGTWLFGLDNWGHAYAKTPEGLALCYTAALPFFGYTLLSDVGFTALLFGAYAVLGRFVVESPVVRELDAERLVTEGVR